MILKSAELRARYVVKRRAESDDGIAGLSTDGFESTGDAPWGTRPKPISANARMALGMHEQRTTHTIRFRLTEKVKPSDRLIWNGRTFEVLSVFDPDGLGEESKARVFERAVT